MKVTAQTRYRAVTTDSVSTHNNENDRFADMLSLWQQRSAAPPWQAHLPFPTRDICSSYQLELADPQRRRGFVLREKKASYLMELQRQRSNSCWPYHGDFWSWLDAESDGASIPRVWHVPAERLQDYRVLFKGNHISKPATFTSFLSASQMNSTPSDQTTPEEVMYVMSPRGEFYAHRKVLGSVTSPAFHHSSFMRGGRVSGAGVFFVDPTHRLIRLNDWSGHYEPTEENTYHVMKSLEGQGVDLDTVEYFRWRAPEEITCAGTWKRQFEASKVAYRPRLHG